MINSGFVLLDKAAGETSFKALFPLKRLFKTKRVGHAGTLDLRASGLIIAAIGRATRILPFVEAKDKCYSFRLHLGYETDTLEWDGTVVSQDENSAIFSKPVGEIRKALEESLSKFIGDINQVPPKYSAVKVNGHRASDLTERGRDIELLPRKVRIDSLKVVGNYPDFTEDPSGWGKTEGCSGHCYAVFDLECECSKGTYIRSLGRDLANALGTVGCVSKIRRQRIGKITLDFPKVSIADKLTTESLVPVNEVLDFPVLKLNDEQLKFIRLGNWIPWKDSIENMKPDGNLFLANQKGEVLSFAHYEPGRIWPKIYLAEDEA